MSAVTATAVTVLVVLAVPELFETRGVGGVFLFWTLILLSHLVGLRLAVRADRGLRYELARVADETAAIAEGDARQRVGEPSTPELAPLVQSVNEVADRLIREQALLEDNIRSLDETNRELVEARNEVLRAARLASVGTLGAGVAHEIGNPLSAIFAYVDIVKARLKGSESNIDLLDSIRAEAERIDRIVRSLLDYARPAKEARETFRVLNVVESVRELIASQGKLDRVDDQWLVGDPDCRIQADPHYLEQILVNLLLNGLEAMGDGPERSIEVELKVEAGPAMVLPTRRRGDPPGVTYAHRRRLHRARNGAESLADPLVNVREVVAIRVRDNGPGIAEEHLDRVFDPFFTTKGPGEGTGLGLSICARLADAMGGRIEASNRVSGGAEFAIRFPLAVEADEAEPVLAGSVPAFSHSDAVMSG